MNAQDKTMSQKYPLLFNNSKYAFGMILPQSSQASYTLENIKERGAAAIEKEIKAVESKREFEWLMNTYNRIKNETIADYGHFETPKDLVEHQKILTSLTIGQLKDKIETVEFEIDDTKKIAEHLTEAVFAEEVQKEFDKTGTTSVCFAHFGHDRIETFRGTEYENLVALTKEKLTLLTEVGNFFSEVKELYEKELAERQARLPAELKILTKNAKNLVDAGKKVSKELEKVAARFKRDRTPENRAEFRRLWDSYGGLNAEYMSVLNKIHLLNPQTHTEEFPDLSSEIRCVYRSIGMLGIV